MNNSKVKELIKEASKSKDAGQYWGLLDRAIIEIGYDSEEEREVLEGALSSRFPFKK